MKRERSKKMLTKMLGAGVVLAGAVALNGTAAKAANDVAINENNFPDAVFREYVWSSFDQDKNGNLESAEIEAVQSISIHGEQIDIGNADYSNYTSKGVQSLKGVEFFPNLTELNCSCNDITALDLSGNPSLLVLNCSNNKLAGLNINANTELKDINFSYNQIKYLDVRNCPKLERVSVYGRSLSMSGSYLPGQNTIERQTWVYDDAGNIIDTYRIIMDLNSYLVDGVTAIPVVISEAFPDQAFAKFVSDTYDADKDGVLTPDEADEVKEMNCSNKQIVSLQGIENFKKVEKLDCSNNKIAGLDVSKMYYLQSLHCNDNPMTELKLFKCSEPDYTAHQELRELFCYNCQLTELDVTDNFVMDAFEVGDKTVENNVVTYKTKRNTLIVDKGVKITSLNKRMPSSVNLDKTSLLIVKGQAQKLNALVDEDADQTVTWSSNNTKVATVDANGNVTFKGAGTAKITVKTVNGKTATCEVTCLVENIESNPFADIASDNWAFTSMKDMLDKKIMVGTGELAGKIVSGCDNVLTRAQFARILYSMENEPAVEYSAVFSDVQDGLWYTKPIMWANANKLIVGKGSYFDIDAPATREQIATILKRYAEFKGLDVSVAEGIDEKIAGFSDKGSISSWAQEGLSWAISHEIMFGKPNSVLDPNGEATRAECAAMVSRFLNNIK